jgi:hypothetical protein
LGVGGNDPWKVLEGLPAIEVDDDILLKVYAENLLLALRASGSAFFKASREASSPSLWLDVIGLNELRGGVANDEGSGIDGGKGYVGMGFESAGSDGASIRMTGGVILTSSRGGCR